MFLYQVHIIIGFAQLHFNFIFTFKLGSISNSNTMSKMQDEPLKFSDKTAARRPRKRNNEKELATFY